MTYGEIRSRLENAGIDAPDWDAKCLISFFCHRPLNAPLADGEDFSSPALADAVSRRCAREPLQYLLGEWEFYRQVYEVSPDCLIPRSDTEILVEHAIRALPPGARFADLCTGSGCIAVSVLAERPDTRAVAVEKFAPTLALAERNAARNRVADRMEGVLSDVLLPGFSLPGAPFDAILSNPPYVPAGEIPSLSPEVRSEPAAALDGGADGLDFYRAILAFAPRFLKPDGFLLLEIGFDQAKAVRDVALSAGFDVCRVLRDYGGNDRVVHVSRKRGIDC